MNLIKKIFLFFVLFSVSSCANYSIDKSKKDKDRIYYNSIGFTLIYDEKYYEEKTINKKIDNDKLVAMHSFLRKNTPIKIINPENSKSITTKIHANIKHPKIFNIVISKKIAEELELDFENPYIEIIEMKKNDTFIAKEGKIFDEEKKVAENVPVDEINVKELTPSNNETKPAKTKNKENKFILIISDFYYADSANKLKTELINQTKINKFSVLKINNNKYRLSVGPFKNFNSLKSTYISLNNLGFEDLNIIRK